jgi:lysophospholipase L1-like esterase
MTVGYSVRAFAKDTLVITLVTILIFLVIDFFAGSAVLSMIRKEGKRDTFRTSHPRYHHTLQPSYEGPAYWGPFSYKVCTNASQMKSRCIDTLLDEKHFDIGFIGDSFTEGVGVPYEDSFVGMVAKAHPELKVANLGVVSYSPTIYLKKLEDYLKRGYTFKKIIVFVDIGDIMDEAQYIEDEQGNVLLAAEQIQPGVIALIKRKVKKNLPLAYESLHQIKQATLQIRKGSAVPSLPRGSVGAPSTKELSQPVTPEPVGSEREVVETPIVQRAAQAPPAKISKEPWIYEREYARSAWTYNLDAPNYGDLGVRRSIEKAVSQMERVAELLRAHNTALSVGVYPWPAQLIFDKEDSLQVQIWKSFCENRCADFYNSFPLFFEALRSSGIDATIAKYYFPGDMHFGREGNALVAETILRKPLVAP